MTLRLPEDLRALIGKEIPVGEANYRLTEHRGSGKRGHVFRAETEDGRQRALKFIPEDKLCTGWEQEVRKAYQLEGQPNTVRFSHMSCHGSYLVLVFDFVGGESLRHLISSGTLSVGYIELILYNLLFFHKDCLGLGVSHGDLHPGNIIVRPPSAPSLGPPLPVEVMITDFGIGHTGAVLSPKDDLTQIGLIALQMLQSVKRESLDHMDRRVYDELCRGPFRKSLQELSPLERGQAEGVVDRLMADLKEIRSRLWAPEHSAVSPRFGDYLAGEQLGERLGEWEALFVGNFPGYDDIVSRNITVLTGARGCGKTMGVRRLSALRALQIGPADDGAAKSFVGFYLNMNDISDAFLFDRDTRMTENLAKRTIQFLHLSLLSEIVRVAAVAREKQADNRAGGSYERGTHWLFNYVLGQLGESRLYPGVDLDMREITSLLERAKDEVRRSRNPPARMAGLAENDWIKRFVPKLQSTMPWVGDKPVYFFLDDYSLPRVNEQIQRVLNSVIFQRADRFFFKISTESPSTFCRQDYTGKSLEEPDDFELTDLGSTTIYLADEDRERFLDEVFRKRFQRDGRFRDKDLADVLGEFEKSWAELAREIRHAKPSASGESGPAEASGKALYYGRKVFLNMWSGDTRNMVRIALNLISQLPDEQAAILPVKRAAQDSVFRRTGGEFLHLLEACTRTSQEGAQDLPEFIASWGKHLAKIAHAFKDIALHELRTRGGGRTGRPEPKQAFRIEIVDKMDLSGIEKEIYEDLVRYGVFLRDVRGKSIRGAIVPRLYFRRLLIPFCTLTFSKVDNIALKVADLKEMLLYPEQFAMRWKKDRPHFDVGQRRIFD